MAFLIIELGNIEGARDFGGGSLCGVDEEYSLEYDKFEMSNRQISGDIK